MKMVAQNRNGQKEPDVPEVTEVSFDTTVEVEINGQPEEVTVHVRVVKSVVYDATVMSISIKDDSGKDVELESLSGPEQQELLDQIGVQFDTQSHGRGSVMNIIYFTLNHPSINVYVVTYYPTTSRYKPLHAFLDC